MMAIISMTGVSYLDIVDFLTNNGAIINSDLKELVEQDCVQYHYFQYR